MSEIANVSLLASEVYAVDIQMMASENVEIMSIGFFVLQALIYNETV
jgi:hypothetical protein